VSAHKITRSISKKAIWLNMTVPIPQARNPLHGITLEQILTELVEYGGWQGLGEQINIKCFNVDPSMASSLNFLRKTPWARAQVESLYFFMRRQKNREAKAQSKSSTQNQAI
jgi:uncharacterized protein (DUF2132 family)